MGLFPLKAPVDCAIAVWPWGTYLGDEGVKHGVRVKVSSIQSLDAQRDQPGGQVVRPVPEQPARQDRGR